MYDLHVIASQSFIFCCGSFKVPIIHNGTRKSALSTFFLFYMSLSNEISGKNTEDFFFVLTVSAKAQEADFSVYAIRIIFLVTYSVQ